MAGASPTERGVPPEQLGDGECVVETVLRRGFRRVMLIGPVDTGKSTISRALLSEAARRGRPAALIDADVGQKTVGPPAAVTAAHAGAPDVLAELAFAGTTNPLQGFGRVVAGLRRIAQRMEDRLLIANTSGLLGSGGQALKAAKIEAFRPDLVVLLGSDPVLDRILAGFSGASLRLAPSPFARRKTRGQRRAAREDAFRRYFADAAIHRIGPDAFPDDAPMPERLLVGLADRDGRDMALGVLLGSPEERPGATVLAPALDREVARVLPGKLVLEERYGELPLAPPRSS